MVITTYSVLESDYRKNVLPTKVACEYCGKKYYPVQLKMHLAFWCGPDAQRTDAQAKTVIKKQKKGGAAGAGAGAGAAEGEEEEEEEEEEPPLKKGKSKGKGKGKGTAGKGKGKSKPDAKGKGKAAAEEDDDDDDGDSDYEDEAAEEEEEEGGGGGHWASLKERWMAANKKKRAALKEAAAGGGGNEGEEEAGAGDAPLVAADKSVLHSVRWHRIILDEAHCIKDRASNTAKAVFALSSSFKWALSGTPLQNRVAELYSQIRFLQVDPVRQPLPIMRVAPYQEHTPSAVLRCGTLRPCAPPPLSAPVRALLLQGGGLRVQEPRLLVRPRLAPLRPLRAHAAAALLLVEPPRGEPHQVQRLPGARANTFCRSPSLCDSRADARGRPPHAQGKGRRALMTLKHEARGIPAPHPPPRGRLHMSGGGGGGGAGAGVDAAAAHQGAACGGPRAAAALELPAARRAGPGGGGLLRGAVHAQPRRVRRVRRRRHRPQQLRAHLRLAHPAAPGACGRKRPHLGPTAVPRWSHARAGGVPPVSGGVRGGP